jgi:hypothetical protein
MVQKGDSHLLCEAPFGPFRQKVAVTFLNHAGLRRAEGQFPDSRNTIWLGMRRPRNPLGTRLCGFAPMILMW